MVDKYIDTPWDPKALDVAEEVIAGIKGVAPELEVTFMGAVPLRISGRHDIDLDILCDTEKLDHYKGVFENHFGPAATNLVDSEYWVHKDDEVYWAFKSKGFDVDLILHHPDTKHFRDQTKIQEALINNPELLETYVQLKKECDGKTIAEYEHKKHGFFMNIINTKI